MNTLNAEVVLETEVEYTLISRGRPATGPTYSCGGEPAEAPEYEIIIRCNGLDITAALSDEQLDEIRARVEEDDEPPVDDGPDDFDDSD